GDLVEELLAPLGIERRLERLLVGLDEREPALPADEHRIELGERVLVVGDRAEDAPVRRARLLDVAEAPIVDVAERARDLQGRRPVAGLVVEELLVDEGEAVPALEDGGQPDELIADGAVVGVLAEHLAVPAERALQVLELLLVQTGDAARELQAA